MKGRGFRWAGVVVGLGLLLLQAGLYPAPFACDDAYIAFRYARNAAEGEGLVFNPGERVEGYTGFLWVVLLAAGRLAGVDIPETSRVLGLLFAALTILLVSLWPARLLRGDCDPPAPGAWGGLAAALLGAAHPLAYHAVLGLETTMAAFLLTAALMATDWRGGRMGAGAGMLWLLALLTRPEAVVWWGVAVAVCLARAARTGEGGTDLRHRTRGLLLTVPGFAAFLAWRLAYYGQLVPNTWFAKRGVLGDDLASGSAYLASWVAGGTGLVVLGAVGLVWLRRRKLLGWAVPLLGAHLAAVVFTGGDHMWLWRFFIPFLPLEALLLARAALDLPGVVGAHRPGLRRGLTSLTAGAVALALAVPGLVLSGTIRETFGRYDRKWIFLGRHLAGIVTPETTIALSPVGAIPWFTGARALDLLGLTQPVVARAPVDRRIARKGHQHHDGAWVVAQRPDLFILGNGIVVGRPGRGGPLEWYPALEVREDLTVVRGPPVRWPDDLRVLAYEEDVFDDVAFRREYRPVLLPLGDGLALVAWSRVGEGSGVPDGGVTVP